MFNQYSIINMPQTIIYREKYGINGHSSVYVRNPKGDSSLVQLSNGLVTPPQQSLYSSLVNFFVEVFLPQGYPESVREDYCRYQIWDTVQAFCSTISGILTTHAIMKSVGVGDATATAVSATLTWVLKDGIGMIGRIVFAWWKGHALDTDSKKWRLFADFLNDAAMCLELLLLPIFSTHSTQILCFTTSMKGIVGVAGGASRASITQHHALRGNNGDVSAKDGSQETCVNLVASSIGMAMLSYTEDKMMIWTLFTAVTLLHLLSNYMAVKSLNLVTFNGERLNRYIRSYLRTDTSYSPKEVNRWESCVVGISYTDKDLCGFKIRLGYSLRQLVESKKISSEELVVMADMFRNRTYLLLPHVKSRTIFVMFNPAATTQDFIQAYFHSVLLAVAICHLDNIRLNILTNLQQSVVLKRIEQGWARTVSSSPARAKQPLEAVTIVEDIVDKEFLKFFDGVKTQGWSTECHSLEVNEWRGEWRDSDLRESAKNK
uniref:DUF647 domain-containing protein n=1 Tax=Cuerna arida TaxID=1464854 RepID=A0A1B6EI35_9HEMI